MPGGESLVCARCGAESAGDFVICPACGDWYSFRPRVLVPLREATGTIRAVPLSKLLPRQRTYRVLAVGDVPSGDPAVVLMSGPPGGGKSTLALQMAESVGQRGSLYVSAEEGLGETFRIRVRDLEITTDRIHVAPACHQPDVLALLHDTQSQWVFLDSWSVLRWTVQDLLALKADGYSVCFIVHATKADDPAGSLTLEHLADCAVWVEGLRWTHRKNRYGPLSSGTVREVEVASA